MYQHRCRITAKCKFECIRDANEQSDFSDEAVEDKSRLSVVERVYPDENGIQLKELV